VGERYLIPWRTGLMHIQAAIEGGARFTKVLFQNSTQALAAGI